MDLKIIGKNNKMNFTQEVGNIPIVSKSGITIPLSSLADSYITNSAMKFLTYRCVRILVGQFDFSLLNNILRRDQIGGCIHLTVFSSSNYTMKVCTV